MANVAPESPSNHLKLVRLFLERDHDMKVEKLPIDLL